MNTQHLKEFVKISESGSFWDAAELLYMNQSTLSKHIKALEEELDVPLFSRTTRKVELTKYGEAFLPYARSIIRSEYDGSAAIQHLKDAEAGTVTIAAIPVLSQYRITRLLTKFQQKYPEASVRIIEDDSSNLPVYLENGSCEFLFIREDHAALEKGPLARMAICRYPYTTDHLIALLPENHKLAGRHSISLQELSGERFCLFKEGSLIYEKCIEACRNAGFMPDICFTSHRVESLIDVACSSGCVALLMEKHLAAYTARPGAERFPWVTADIYPQIRSQISLYSRADKPLSEMAQHFLDHYTELLDSSHTEIKDPPEQTGSP